MFLSRLRVDPWNSKVHRDLADAEQLHRTVMRGFPQHDGRDARAAFGVLFRVEAQGPESVVLVQSAMTPAWEKLPEGYLLGHEVKPLDAFVEAIEDGRHLRFRLLANPTRKVADGSKAEGSGYNSRRKAILDEDDRHGWLLRRAELAGFEFAGTGPQGGVRQERRPPLGRGGKSRQGLHVRPALFEGLLRVGDAERFREALVAGIGPAKAYGCGLLSVG